MRNYRSLLNLKSLLVIGVAFSLFVLSAEIASRQVDAQSNRSVQRLEKETGQPGIPNAPAADGDLDPTFGPADAPVAAGTSRFFFGATTADAIDQVRSIAFQTVGVNADKIIAAGSRQTTAPFALSEAVVRLTTAGIVDTTFAGGAGKLTNDYPGASAGQAFDVAVVPGSDKIVVVGNATFPNAPGLNCSSVNNNLTISVYSADGVLDPTFDGDGRKVIDLFGCLDTPTGVVIEPNADPALSKIVILTTALNQTPAFEEYLVLTRLTMTGAADTTFNGGIGGNTTGNVTFLQGGGAPGSGSDLARIPSGTQAGKFIVVGLGNFSDGMIARFNTNGSLDNAAGTGFGPTNNGSINIDYAGNNDFFSSVAIQNDGKIVAAGVANSFVGSSEDFALARVQVNGTLDPTFSGDGKQTVNFLPAIAGAASSADSATRVDITFGGLVVVSGLARTDLSPSDNLGIARLTAAGVLDATFNGDGLATTKLSGSSTNSPGPRTGALQANGRILVGGSLGVPSGSGTPDMFVARFQNSGVTAADVSVSGLVRTADGRGLTNARVKITDAEGASHTVITGRSGAFRFYNIESGKSYIISVISRRYFYSPQIIQINDDVSGLIFLPENADRKTPERKIGGNAVREYVTEWWK